MAFQNRSLPWIMSHYESGLRWALKGWRPVWLLFGTFVLLIFSFVFLVVRKVPVVFFPKGDPNFIFVYLKLTGRYQCRLYGFGYTVSWKKE